MEKPRLHPALNRLRLVGALEGLSYLLLLFVAVPLKYLSDRPEMVQIVGPIHGGLFVLFVAAVADVWWRAGWSAARGMGALVASVIPFGTFVLDARLRKDVRDATQPSVPVL